MDFIINVWKFALFYDVINEKSNNEVYITILRIQIDSLLNDYFFCMSFVMQGMKLPNIV